MPDQDKIIDRARVGYDEPHCVRTPTSEASRLPGAGPRWRNLSIHHGL
jgi:hypothetical protein